MEYGKYIIVELRGCELAIMFDPIISHCTIGEGWSNVISAGFFIVNGLATDQGDDDIEVTVFGKSITLKLDSREEDARFLKKVLRKDRY